MKIFSENIISKDLKIGIIISRFNEFITSKLLDGTLDGLVRHGVNKEDIEIAWVPGSFEIPLIAKKMAESRNYNALISLGAIIRGETPHFDYVANEVSKGIASISLQTQIPIIFGILTTNTTEQAIERAGIKSGNKGWDAALAAIEMANLIQKF